MARVRVDQNDVASAVDAFRPGGSATPLGADRDYPGHQHFNLSQGIDFATNTVYPIAGKVAKLVAGLGHNIGNAVSDAQGAERGATAGPDLTALRAAAAERIRQKYAQERGVPVAAAPVAPRGNGIAIADQSNPYEQRMRQVAADERVAREQSPGQMPNDPAAQLRWAQDPAAQRAWSAQHPAPAGMPLAPMHEAPMHPDVQDIHDRVFDPHRPHIAEDDLKRYTELRKSLAKARTPAEGAAIHAEMQLLQEKITNGPERQPSTTPQGARPQDAQLATPPTPQNPMGTPDAAATAAYRAQQAAPTVKMVQTPKGMLPATRIDQNRVMLHDPSTDEFVIVTRNPDGTKRTQLLTGAQANALLSAEERAQYKPEQAAQHAAPAPVPPAAASTMDLTLAGRKDEIERRIDELYRQRGRMEPQQMAEFNDLREELDALNQEPAPRAPASQNAPQAPQIAETPKAAPETAAPATAQPAASVAEPAATAPAKAETPAEEAPATDLNARLMQLAAKARAGTMTAEDHRESQLLMQHYNAMRPSPAPVAAPQRMNQEQMILAAAAADTPEKKAALARQIDNAGVYSDDLFDLVTGSHDARAKFAQHLASTMPHAQPHQAQTPEQAAHLVAQTGLAEAQRDYYKNAKTPDVAADNAREDKKRTDRVAAEEAKLKERAAEATGKQTVAQGRLDQQKVKDTAEATYKAAKTTIAKDSFALKTKIEELKKKLGYYDPRLHKGNTTTINVGRDSVAAGRELVDAADKVLHLHAATVADIHKKAAELESTEPAKPGKLLSEMTDKERDNLTFAEVEQEAKKEATHNEKMQLWRDNQAKKSALDAVLQQLEKDANDPASDVGEARNARKDGLRLIQHGAPKAKK